MARCRGHPAGHPGPDRSPGAGAARGLGSAQRRGSRRAAPLHRGPGLGTDPALAGGAAHPGARPGAVVAGAAPRGAQLSRRLCPGLARARPGDPPPPLLAPDSRRAPGSAHLDGADGLPRLPPGRVLPGEAAGRAARRVPRRLLDLRRQRRPGASLPPAPAGHSRGGGRGRRSPEPGRDGLLLETGPGAAAPQGAPARARRRRDRLRHERLPGSGLAGRRRRRDRSGREVAVPARTPGDPATGPLRRPARGPRALDDRRLPPTGGRRGG